MATRNGILIDIIWVLVDLAHPQINGLINSAGQLHRGQISTELSVNRNIADTQALIKIASTAIQFNAALAVNARGAIVRIFTEADHNEARAMVAATEWAPSPEGRI